MDAKTRSEKLNEVLVQCLLKKYIVELSSFSGDYIYILNALFMEGIYEKHSSYINNKINIAEIIFNYRLSSFYNMSKVNDLNVFLIHFFDKVIAHYVLYHKDKDLIGVGMLNFIGRFREGEFVHEKEFKKYLVFTLRHNEDEFYFITHGLKLTFLYNSNVKDIDLGKDIYVTDLKGNLIEYKKSKLLTAISSSDKTTSEKYQAISKTDRRFSIDLKKELLKNIEGFEEFLNRKEIEYENFKIAL